MEKNLETFTELLSNLIDFSSEALAEYPMLQLNAENTLRRLHGQLAFVAGSGKVEMLSPRKDTFGPVTEFMGDKLDSAKEVKEEDLSPRDLEIKLFKERGEKLKAALPTLSNEVILDSYKTPADQKVVRLVGRWAGLENFKEGEINEQFLDDIRLGLEAQAELTAKKETEQNAINNQQ